MTWLAWRLQRPVVLALAAATAAAVVFLAVTGAIQDHSFGVYSALGCAQPGSSARCFAAAQSYYSTATFSTAGAALGVALPGLAGLLLGAPAVAQELGERTNRFAWAQSATRGRWLGGKLSVGGLLTAASFACLVPFFGWWTGAVQRGEGILPRNFDLAGIVPVAYACFAYALGLALGALTGRAGWAFAVGVPLFAGARLVIDRFVRPVLVPPVTTASTLPTWQPAHAWVLASGYLPAGRLAPAPGSTWTSSDAVVGLCSPTRLRACMLAHHLRDVVRYQPASHFWPLQLSESGIYLLLAAGLVAVALLKVRAWQA